MAGRIAVSAAKCTGCKLCEVACSWEKEGLFRPSKARIRVHRWSKEAVSVPVLCVQCDWPACQESCPTDAISRDPRTGAMLVDEDSCSGCQECVQACPFGAIEMDSDTDVARMCDLCRGDPECVKVCFPGALTWMPDGGSRVSTGARYVDAVRIAIQGARAGR